MVYKTCYQPDNPSAHKHTECKQNELPFLLSISLYVPIQNENTLNFFLGSKLTRIKMQT